MAIKKTADQWFAEYSECHQHSANRWIHAISAPIILCCLVGFCWLLPLPEAWQEEVPWFNWALVAMLVVLFLYFRLSPALSAGMLFLLAICYMIIVIVELFAPWSVGAVCAVVFALAWIAQMVGRILEHRTPSFSKDLLFLFLGPVWLVSRVYRQLGQEY